MTRENADGTYDRTLIKPENFKRNLRTLNFARICTSAVAGVGAGVLGCNGRTGLAGYFVMAALCNLAVMVSACVRVSVCNNEASDTRAAVAAVDGGVFLLLLLMLFPLLLWVSMLMMLMLMLLLLLVLVAGDVQLKMRMNVPLYLQSTSKLWLDNLMGGTVTYILFWTLAFNCVHIY